MTDSNALPMETDVETLRELLESGADFLLLDVREDEEYATARIEGATLIPMSQLGQRLEELTEHQGRHIVVHCHHGVRSLRVTEALRQRGFEKAQSLAGGIAAWSERIDPSVPTY